MPNTANTANTANTDEIVEAAGTAIEPEIVELALIPHDSNSLLYIAARDELDGFRVNTDSPASVLSKIETRINGSKATAPAKAAGLAALASLPVVVASRGIFSVRAVIDGDATLPEQGDAGYTLSLIGFKSLELPDTTAQGGKAKKNGIWAMAIYPAHSTAAALETESGKAWLQGIMDKEIGLVAFRQLRVAYGETTLADLSESAFAMPCALSDYTDRSRASGETFGTFNDLWPLFKAQMAKNPNTAKLVEVLPTRKQDMLDAIRSTRYAEVKFPALESAGIIARIASIFGAFVATVASEAEKNGEPVPYASSDVTRWLEGRDALDLVRAQTEGVDVDSLNDALAAFGIA